MEDSSDTDGSGAVNDENDAELINKANADKSGVVNDDVEIKKAKDTAKGDAVIIVRQMYYMYRD